MGRVEILALLTGTSSPRVETLLKQWGVNFNPTDDYLQDVKAAGGRDTLLDALRAAGKTAPPEGGAASPAPGDHEAEVLAHVARGAALHLGGSATDEIKEFHSAPKTDPDNPYVHFALGSAIARERGDKSEAEAIKENRKAIELQPDFADAHLSLAYSFVRRRDFASAIPEFREAVRLDPGNMEARTSLGLTLLRSGDFDAAAVVYQDCVRLEPSNPPTCTSCLGRPSGKRAI